MRKQIQITREYKNSISTENLPYFEPPAMSSTTSQNPPDIIDGPRKRLPSKCVTENGDTFINKKAKTSRIMKNSLGNKLSASNVSCRASVEDVVEPVLIPHSQPLHADHVIKAADGSDDDSDDDMPGLEDIDDDDDDDEAEDDEAELHMICSFLYCQYTENNNRPSFKGVGCTYLCLL